MRSGRRRAAREAADDEGEGSSGEQTSDPNVLDTLKAAGLLDAQRVGGRRRARDDEEQATVAEASAEPSADSFAEVGTEVGTGTAFRPVSESVSEAEPEVEHEARTQVEAQVEPKSEPEPEPMKWRVEAPPRLRVDPPVVDMFDSPTMVQPVVRDDDPPVGLGAAFVKGPLIPTARVPDPPDYPNPPVPDFATSRTEPTSRTGPASVPPFAPGPMSAPGPASASATGPEAVAEPGAVAERPVFPAPRPVPVVDFPVEDRVVGESTGPAAVERMSAPEPRPELLPAPLPEHRPALLPESRFEPAPEQASSVRTPSAQAPSTTEPDQVPTEPIPDPVPGNPSSSDVPSPPPPVRFGPTGFLSAADVEHDDAPESTPERRPESNSERGPETTGTSGASADPAEEAGNPFVTAVVVGGKTIDLPPIVQPTRPPVSESPSATRASRRHKSDLSLAELLAEALVAYEDARREDETGGRFDEDTAPIPPVDVRQPAGVPESDTETTTPIRRVDPPPAPRFDTWTLPES